ncbi:hypothetical protein DCAR_0312662 [Daucus carota subsp. sativus]|uniref:Uncharacterized protein n=1 Tax=Daucus carota subsp. sativus TaxID=79200 RepID=A0A166B756_DAUCS|nr:hypothetical protein DCAR_0312662 [Daucus carota subsp. sativus]
MACQKIALVLAVCFVFAALSVSAQVSPAAPPSTDAAVGLISFESMLIGVFAVAVSFFALTAAV